VHGIFDILYITVKKNWIDSKLLATVFTVRYNLENGKCFWYD